MGFAPGFFAEFIAYGVATVGSVYAGYVFSNSGRDAKFGVGIGVVSFAACVYAIYRAFY